MRPLVAAALLLLPLPASADTLIDNVVGITLDENGSVKTFNGLLIGDDGRIEQVLDRKDKRPKRVDYQLDGKGRVLVPGMIDSHVEVMELGLAQLTLDLSVSASADEALSRIAAYAAAHPDRQWILGRGWRRQGWDAAGASFGTAIGAATEGRPVWLVAADGRSGWASNAALAEAGIGPDTKDPVGGRIERLPGGQPSGILVGTAMELLERRIPPPRPEDRDIAFLEAQQILLRQGITTVADMGATIEDWQSYRRAGDRGALLIRIVAYADGTGDMTLIGGPGPTPWLYEDRLRLNGVNLRLDGALASRGAWLKAPYSDDPANRGLVRMNDTQLSNLMSRAAIDDFQVAVQASGDAATAAVLDAIAELTQTYKGDRRWRIESAHVVDPAQFARFAQFGVHASMQPEDVLAWQVDEARLGPERLAGVLAWRSLDAAGAGIAFGSGSPARAIRPFAGMAAAVTRQGEDGQPFTGWQPQERLSREAAFAAYTANAARALFAEDRFGRLTKGQRADFLLIDHDPLLATPEQLREIRVLQTWINGKQVYEAKAKADAREGR